MATIAFLFHFSDGERTIGGRAENNARSHVSRRFE